MRNKISNTFLLLLSFGFLFSCTSDDSAVKVKSDLIVGDWERQKEVYVFENDSVVINDFSICPETNFLVFMDEEYDRAFAVYFYTPINEASLDSCHIVSGGGAWTKASDGKYSVHIEYFEEYDPYDVGEETILLQASFPAADTLFLYNRNKLEQYQTEMENLQDFYTVYALDDGGIDYAPYLP